MMMITQSQKRPAYAGGIIVQRYVRKNKREEIRRRAYGLLSKEWGL